MQGGEGATVWTLLAQHHLALSHVRHWQVLEEHHSHKLKGLHMDYYHLMELLLLEFRFKRAEIRRNARVLSPFLSLPLNL